MIKMMNIPLLIFLFVAIPVTALCVVKSIVSKNNLYNVPAAIFALLLSTMYFPNYLSDIINGYILHWEFIRVLFFLWYFIFCPMLAIFLFSRANKGVLAFPLIYWISINFIDFFEFIEYFSTRDIISEFLWFTGIIFAVVIIFARKPLKNIFFVPGAILLLGEIIAYMTYSYYSSIEIIIRDITYISMIVLICKYVVTEAEENPKPCIPQPATDFNHQLNNVANNYNNNQFKDFADTNSEVEIPGNSKSDNIADELLKYRDLLDKGLISEEDYNAKKNQILGI